MKQLLHLTLLVLALPLCGQSDTTVYKITDEAARFPGCETLDTTIEYKIQCSQKALMLYFNQNMQYPAEAREANIEGTVVVSFIVEKDGTVTRPTLLKDIGGGCGAEALRVASGMNQALEPYQLKWTPAKKGGKFVRSQVTVPVKFKLQEPDDFVIINGRDSVWVVVDDSLRFKGGEAALSKFVADRLRTPERYRDSCRVGTMDLTLVAHPSGGVLVLDLSDYWNLGNDFRWEAIKAATQTWGHWLPATRKGRAVPSSVEITVTFRPDAAKCAQAIANFERASALAEEGSQLFNEGKQEEGLAKLNKALELFPNNANFLYLRGQAYMNTNRMTEACEDFKQVRQTVFLDVVEKLIPLICK